MRTRALTLTLVLVLCAATSLAAHDLFLKLDSYFLAPHTAVRIPLLNGEFDRSENSVTRDRVRDLAIVSEGGTTHPSSYEWEDTGDTTFLELTTGEPGTAVIGVSTIPRELALDAKAFNGYLREEGILDVLAARRRDHALGAPARERYSKHVKAIVQVGDRRTVDFSTALGYPAEIVPLDNPYTLRPGAQLRVRCDVDGAPVPNLVVIAGSQRGAGRPHQRQLRTDAHGIARLRLTGPGRWYVKFVRMVPSRDSSVDYESKWATLTFEVRAR